jgi:hypothetical protein
LCLTPKLRVPGIFLLSPQQTPPLLTLEEAKATGYKELLRRGVKVQDCGKPPELEGIERLLRE